MAWSGATSREWTPLQIVTGISPAYAFETPRRDTMHTETAKSYHFAASQRKAHVARIVRDFLDRRLTRPVISPILCHSITFGRLPYQPVII